MDFDKYKKYVINEKYYNQEKIDVSDWFSNYLNPLSIRCKDRFKIINHPLVDSGKAIWINNNTLCVGYKLIENENIIFPLFNPKKQNLLADIHKNIIS